MISIYVAVRLFADVSVKHVCLEVDKRGQLPSAADIFYIFIPIHPRGSVFYLQQLAGEASGALSR